MNLTKLVRHYDKRTLTGYTSFFCVWDGRWVTPVTNTPKGVFVAEFAQRLEEGVLVGWPTIHNVYMAGDTELVALEFVVTGDKMCVFSDDAAIVELPATWSE